MTSLNICKNCNNALFYPTGHEMAFYILELHNQVLPFIFNIPIDSEAIH